MTSGHGGARENECTKRGVTAHGTWLSTTYENGDSQPLYLGASARSLRPGAATVCRLFAITECPCLIRLSPSSPSGRRPRPAAWVRSAGPVRARSGAPGRSCGN